MAQVRFTEISLHNGLITVDFQFNDVNNRVNHVYVINNHPTATLHIEAEKKDGSQFVEFDILPNTEDDRGVPTTWGVDVGFDPEEGTPTAVFGNYDVRYWASG